MSKANTKLSDRALLIRLHRSTWSGSKVDQEVSEEARRSRNADKSSGRFTKVLVHPKFFTCVTHPLSQADSIFKRLSMPWAESGDRIMTNMAFPQFSREMRAQRSLVDLGKIELRKKEADMHAEAKHRLQGMYKASDYPSIDEIVDSFGMKTEVNKVPEAGDFRCKLGTEEVKAIVDDIEERTKERMEKAANDLYKRVYGVVETMVKTLKEYEPKTDVSKGRNFKDSLIYNVREMADTLPALNITLDPQVDALKVELIDDLTRVPGGILKDSLAAREDTIAKAEKILKKLQGWMV